MAGVVTWSGQTPDDLTREIARMPVTVEAKLRIAARSIAEGVRGDASDAARARGWKLADEVVMTEDVQAHAWVVSVKPANPRPANLPLWLEFGTVKMPAMPFFSPGLLRARQRYPGVMDRALQEAFDATVNK